MTDNIFDRLAELLQSAGPVNWRLASQIAESVAGTADPLDPWVAEEYEELSRTASMLIGGTGAVDPATAPAITITDARSWAADSIESFSYLAEPLAEKMDAGAGMPAGMGLEQILGQLGPALVGMQIGSLVGALAQGLLAPFDAGLPPLGGGSHLIVPNIEALSADEHLDQRQTRLWAALRETAHQSLLGVPWAADHLSGLVADYVAGLEMPTGDLQARLQDLGDPSELERLMSEPGGLGGFAAGPELEGVRDDIAAFLALLGGFGASITAVAAAELLPDLARIEEAAAGRHSEAGPEQVIEQMLGIEIDRSLATAARSFCDDVTTRWGTDARDRLWSAPAALPTIAEIHDPVGWAARVLLPDDLEL